MYAHQKIIRLREQLQEIEALYDESMHGDNVIKDCAFLHKYCTPLADNMEQTFKDTLAPSLVDTDEGTGNPSEDLFAKWLDIEPSLLTHATNRTGNQIPIQYLINAESDYPYRCPKANITRSVKLAFSGVKYGTPDRGGLLSPLPPPEYYDRDRPGNVLQAIFHNFNVRRDFIDKMIEKKLVLRRDVQEHNLLFYSRYKRDIVNQLANLDPGCMKTAMFNNEPMVHAIIEASTPIPDSPYPDWCRCYFRCAFKSHPKNLDVLFLKNSEGLTAFEHFEKLHNDTCNENEIFYHAIENYLPKDATKFPVLHHVFKRAPHLMNRFTTRYSSCFFLRDEDGRTLDQLKLSIGSERFRDDPQYYLGTFMNEEKIREMDPLTETFPFLTAAANPNLRDVDTVYRLLRREPSVLEKYIEHIREKGRLKLKRKRSGEEENHNVRQKRTIE